MKVGFITVCLMFFAHALWSQNRVMADAEVSRLHAGQVITVRKQIFFNP